MARTIFLAPLRLATGWGMNPRVLGWIGISMLVLMRVTLGWHFFSEGHEKYRQGDWDAKPFFANARGPVAGQFRQLVWDWDGQLRLDVERTMVHFAVFRDRVSRHFRFNEAQRRQAQGNYAKAIEQLRWVLEENANDIEEYELGRERMLQLERDKRRTGVPSLAGQTSTIRSEWTGKIDPVLAQIDTVWKNYEAAQNAIASRKQLASREPLKMGVPRNQLVDTSVINRIVPYFDMTIGVLLILGLFTPVAALAGAGFLGSVFISQYPPVTGLGSSYQLIEAMACLVLAGTGAGRFAGLDFFAHAFTQMLWPRNAE